MSSFFIWYHIVIASFLMAVGYHFFLIPEVRPTPELPIDMPGTMSIYFRGIVRSPSLSRIPEFFIGRGGSISESCISDEYDSEISLGQRFLGWNQFPIISIPKAPLLFFRRCNRANKLLIGTTSLGYECLFFIIIIYNKKYTKYDLTHI